MGTGYVEPEEITATKEQREAGERVRREVTRQRETGIPPKPPIKPKPKTGGGGIAGGLPKGVKGYASRVRQKRGLAKGATLIGDVPAGATKKGLGERLKKEAEIMAAQAKAGYIQEKLKAGLEAMVPERVKPRLYVERQKKLDKPILVPAPPGSHTEIPTPYPGAKAKPDSFDRKATKEELDVLEKKLKKSEGNQKPSRTVRFTTKDGEEVEFKAKDTKERMPPISRRTRLSSRGFPRITPRVPKLR